jgi:hypothetical protein
MSLSLVSHRSLVAFAALATSLAASQVYAQAKPAPAPRPRLTVQPPDVPGFPDLPALPSSPRADARGSVDATSACFCDCSRRIARSRSVRSSLYQQARDLIERQPCDRALSQLNRLIAQFDGKPIADSTANRVDAAFYWKAYAQSKQKNLADAQATLQELQKKFATAAGSGRKGARGRSAPGRGQAVSPDGQPDDDLKLLALRGLMQSDPSAPCRWSNRSCPAAARSRSRKTRCSC